MEPDCDTKGGDCDGPRRVLDYARAHGPALRNIPAEQSFRAGVWLLVALLIIFPLILGMGIFGIGGGRDMLMAIVAALAWGAMSIRVIRWGREGIAESRRAGVGNRGLAIMGLILGSAEFVMMCVVVIALALSLWFR